jgi:hypothetical protein
VVSQLKKSNQDCFHLILRMGRVKNVRA